MYTDRGGLNKQIFTLAGSVHTFDGRKRFGLRGTFLLALHLMFFVFIGFLYNQLRYLFLQAPKLIYKVIEYAHQESAT